MTANDLPADDLRIGRYSHAELNSMRGRRGRKPPEFYHLFPELKKAEATQRVPAKQAPAEHAPDPDGLAHRLRLASPAVRRLVEALLALPELAATSTGQLPELAVRVPDAPLATQRDEQVMVVGTGVDEVIADLPLRDPVYADPESDAELGIG